MRKNALTLSALTLIELLVVISIITLLVALILPALGRARDQARKSQCLSQVRQSGGAMTVYAFDYRSHFPADRYSRRLPDNWGHDARNLVSSYLSTWSITHCPSADSTAPYSTNPNDPLSRVVTDYAYVGGFVGNFYPAQPLTYDQHPRASQTMLLADMYRIYDTAPIEIFVYPSGVMAGKSGANHREGIHVFYVDGHAAFRGLSELVRVTYANPGGSNVDILLADK